MSSLCAILRGSFDDYRSDALPSPQRRILREHLAACPACRDLASAEDPTMVFARPIREEVPEAEQQQILAAVRTGVALMETERRIGHSSRHRLGGVAAAAAVAALVFLSPGTGSRRSPQTTLADGATNAPAPAASGIVTPAAAQESVLDPAGLVEQAESPSSHATVYDLNPGAGRGEPRVVWIVDRGLDI
jgi:anti-sigma factor RsiW